MKIEQETFEINVGAGGKLTVPRENFSDEFDDGTELDMMASIVLLKKPNRREWIYVYADMEMPVKMLIHKQNPNAIDSELYYIEQSLRAPVSDELKNDPRNTFLLGNGKIFCIMASYCKRREHMV